MCLRRCFVSTVAIAFVLLGAGTAAAQPPMSTPEGGGCADNGQAVAGAASGPGAFGQLVRTNTPLADDVAAFFDIFCAPDPS
jgi:hypothetical protein